VVGSDVYDKLILLHALREQFDSAMFFVLDLDARLLHHDQFKWTRNAIVASNFDLKLSDYYQCRTHRDGNVEHGSHSTRTPPFRDNYQTALFFACRIAIGLEKQSAGENNDPKAHIMLREDPDEIRRLLTSPRIFEIGRGRAVDLSTGKSMKIHPDRKLFEDWQGFWLEMWRPVLLSVPPTLNDRLGGSY
jgi:hypothetical protein